MTDAWLSGARRIPVKEDGGALKGGAPRAVWFTSESDPLQASARSVAHELVKKGSLPHLVWNPCSGDLVQVVPLTRAGNLLEGLIGREGRACAQIMVVGYAQEPFTSGPLKRLDLILSWLDSWGVPRRWPAGPPLHSPQAYHATRSRRHWARGGHFGYSQVPGASGPDPGGVDIRRITGPATPLADIPYPRVPRGTANGANGRNGASLTGLEVIGQRI